METDFLAWLKNTLPQGDRLLVPIGDDAAVLDWQGDDNCVVTSDLLADGTHFLTNEHAPEQIGRKLAAVNLSDLAAMAARPVGMVVSLLLPRTMPVEEVKRLYAGMLPLAEQFDFTIAGGDTNVWDGKLAVSATAFGVSNTAPLTRSGAKPGDALLVTGRLGGSLAGHHLSFTPRVHEAIQLARDYTVNAAMDISDGLSLDASRIAAASGCGSAIELDSVPIAAAARELASAGEKTALEHALSDGEDFELLLAMPTHDADRLLAAQPLDVVVTRVARSSSKKVMVVRKRPQPL